MTLAHGFFPCLLTHTFHSYSFLSVLRTNSHCLPLHSESKQQLKATAYKSVRSQRNKDQTETVFPAATLQLSQPLEYPSPPKFLALHSLPWKGSCNQFSIASRSEKAEFPHPAHDNTLQVREIRRGFL